MVQTPFPVRRVGTLSAIFLRRDFQAYAHSIGIIILWIDNPQNAMARAQGDVWERRESAPFTHKVYYGLDITSNCAIYFVGKF